MNVHFLTDEELAQHLVNGDAPFNELYKRYRDRLVSFGFKKLKVRTVAEGMTQDLFADIWNRRAHFKIHTSFEAYVFSAMRFAILDHIRHSKIRDAYVDEMLRQVSAVEHTAEYEVCNTDLDQHLHERIETLPEKCKQVFKLSRFEHLSNKEISEVLNISTETTKYHIAHALKVLRTSLKDILAVLIFHTCDERIVTAFNLILNVS